MNMVSGRGGINMARENPIPTLWISMVGGGEG